MLLAFLIKQSMIASSTILVYFVLMQALTFRVCILALAQGEILLKQIGCPYDSLVTREAELLGEINQLLFNQVKK